MYIDSQKSTGVEGTIHLIISAQSDKILSTNKRRAMYSFRVSFFLFFLFFFGGGVNFFYHHEINV